MRGPGRQLSALLCLLLPLIALAWFGQAELGRLEDKVRRSLDEQARGRLEVGTRSLEQQISNGLAELIREASARSPTDLSEVTLAAREREPALLDLFLLDRDANLIAPRRGPDPRLGLLFAQPSKDPDLRTAEALEALGDPDGALAALAPLLTVEGAQRATEAQRTRARFQAAGLMRRLGRTEQSRSLYEALRSDLDRSQRTRGRATRRALSLLCRCGISELDPPPATDLLQEIAKGSYDDAPEPLIQSVWLRLEAKAPSLPASLTSLENERRRGRRFADEFEGLLTERARRTLDENAAPDAIDALPDGQGGLLIWQRVEPQAATGLFANTGAFGVRLDLAQLLRRSQRGQNDFVLELDTPGEDTPDGTLRGLGPFDVPLRIRPSDPERIFDEERRGLRNRTLLFLALIAIAGVGAFQLFRTTRRESELAAAKVAFVSRVGHDLRTPLALIRMYAETLSLGRADDPERRDRCSNVILRETDTLTRQIDRLLDAARRSRADFRFEPEVLALGERIGQLVSGYQKHAESRGAEVRLAIETDAPVDVDPAALDDSVVNLIDNAIKYTPEGDGPRIVEVSIRSSDSEAEIEVSDRGCGVPKADRRRIFDDFQRGSNAGEVRGSGLGLHLVRQFAEAHGGKVRVEDREGSGSRFLLTLPVHSSEDSNA